MLQVTIPIFQRLLTSLICVQRSRANRRLFHEPRRSIVSVQDWRPCIISTSIRPRSPRRMNLQNLSIRVLTYQFQKPSQPFCPESTSVLLHRLPPICYTTSRSPSSPEELILWQHTLHGVLCRAIDQLQWIIHPGLWLTGRYLLGKSVVNGSVPAISEGLSGQCGRHVSLNYLTLSRLRSQTCHALHIGVIGQMDDYSEVIISSYYLDQLPYSSWNLVTS